MSSVVRLIRESIMPTSSLNESSFIIPTVSPQDHVVSMLQEPLTSSSPSLNYVHLLLSLPWLALAVAFFKYVERDYKAFLALGPGGPAYSFRGYIEISFVRCFRIRNPFLAPEMDATARLRPQQGFLSALPPRLGERPELAGVAPQRQITQKSSATMVSALQETIRELATEAPSHLFVSTSAFERHNDALFSKYKTFNEPDYYGEIVHSHASDGSMHVVLHPHDVKTVIERGWGERHPLARGVTWWWRAPVPRGFVILYAPRDEMDLRQIRTIIRAGARWVSGVEYKEERRQVDQRQVGLLTPPASG